MAAGDTFVSLFGKEDSEKKKKDETYAERNDECFYCCIKWWRHCCRCAFPAIPAKQQQEQKGNRHLKSVGNVRVCMDKRKYIHE